MDRTPPASRPLPAGPDPAHPLPPQPGCLPRCLGTASVPVSFADLEKKTAHAAEQDRPDIRKRREAWFEGQLDLDPERLISIDETPAFAPPSQGQALDHADVDVLLQQVGREAVAQHMRRDPLGDPGPVSGSVNRP